YLIHNENDHDRRLMPDSGAERPYLTEIESSRLLGEDIEPEADLQELSEGLEREGIDISLLDGEMPSRRHHRLERELDGSEDVDLAPEEAPDKTNDPVRLYLREMGTVPLLTRQGEIDIAKRFERGHFR